MQWLPIETAPKDGTEVLAVVEWPGGKTSRAVVAWRDDVDGQGAGWAGGFVDWRTELEFVLNATHWTPLPALPGMRPMTERELTSLNAFARNLTSG